LWGGIGAAIFHALGVSTGAGGPDIGSIIGSIVSGGVGESILTAIVGLIKECGGKIQRGPKTRSGSRSLRLDRAGLGYSASILWDREEKT